MKYSEPSPVEDLSRLPLFISILASPSMYFDSFLLFLAGDGAGAVDFYGHSLLVGLWGVVFGLSFLYNAYFLSSSIFREEIDCGSLRYKLLAYIASYQGFLILTYFTYESWGYGIIRFVVGFIGLFFLTFVSGKAIKLFTSKNAMQP